MKQDKYYSIIKHSKNLVKYDPVAYDMSFLIGSPKEIPIWEDSLFFGAHSYSYISFYFPLESRLSTDYIISGTEIKIFDKYINKIIKIGIPK